MKHLGIIWRRNLEIIASTSGLVRCKGQVIELRRLMTAYQLRIHEFVSKLWDTIRSCQICKIESGTYVIAGKWKNESQLTKTVEVSIPLLLLLSCTLVGFVKNTTWRTVRGDWRVKGIRESVASRRIIMAVKKIPPMIVLSSWLAARGNISVRLRPLLYLASKLVQSKPNISRQWLR